MSDLLGLHVGAEVIYDSPDPGHRLRGVVTKRLAGNYVSVRWADYETTHAAHCLIPLLLQTPLRRRTAVSPLQKPEMRDNRQTFAASGASDRRILPDQKRRLRIRPILTGGLSVYT